MKSVPSKQQQQQQQKNSNLASEQVDDLQRVADDADRHQLLAVVAAVHHQRVDQALDNGARRLAEAARAVAACSVRHVHRVAVAHGDVVLVGGW